MWLLYVNEGAGKIEKSYAAGELCTSLNMAKNGLFVGKPRNFYKVHVCLFYFLANGRNSTVRTKREP